MNNVPTHPGNQPPQQQGLGAPSGQSTPNPYYKPSPSLNAYNDKLTGAQALQQAQAMQAGAEAGKAQAETQMLQAVQQQGGLGMPQAEPQVSPQEVQVGQMAEAIIGGQLDQAGLRQLVEAGEIDMGMAEAAWGQAQQKMQPPAEMGLGGQL